MTNIITVKELLNYNIFNDNEYLHKYVSLINDNVNTIKQKFITECHHIIPKIYYKKNKLPINNNDDNLVHLVYADHLLAHCLLALSFNDNYYISASIDSIYAIINSYANDITYYNIEDIINDFEYLRPLLKCNHFISDEQKLKLSEISSNSRWYNNGIKETFTRFKPDDDDWIEGRLPFNQEQRDKLSKHSSACQWYNNGIDSKFLTQPQDGYIYKGRLDIRGDNNPSKNENVKSKIRKSKLGKPKGNSRKCICVETGQVFESAFLAAEWLGSKLSVSKACNEPWRTRGGYHWAWYD